jgi:type III restriction enzyme
MPSEQLTANFTTEHEMDLTPDLVGATETQNSGIIGEQVDLNLVHTGDVRPSQVLYELTTYLIMHKFAQTGELPPLHLFGQLKRVCKEWLDKCLHCKGGTYPAQLKYKTLADAASDRIIEAINRTYQGNRPITAIFDPYNPVGSTAHVRFTTSKTDRWQPRADRCHVNWIILDSDWEAELCRVVESHPQVRAYVKNHNLGLEVPYRTGGESRLYRPDFLILVDDGHGDDDLLRLIIEIKGYRGEDAKDKARTMETYWIPAVNNSKQHGRWAFAEFTDVYQIQANFKAKMAENFADLLAGLRGG